MILYTFTSKVRWLPGRLPGSLSWSAAARPLTPRELGGEIASRREVCLVLRHRLEKMEVTASDFVQELAQERLMVGLAQRLVALWEIIAFLHFEAFERLDQLHGIVAAVEFRSHHRHLQSIHGLVVRLHVAIGQRSRRIDLGEPCFGVVEEPAMVRRVQRPLEYRDITIDGDEALDLVAERWHVGRFANGAITGPFVFLGETEVVGLVTDSHAVLAEEDAKQSVETAGDLRQERCHVGSTQRNAGCFDDIAARLFDLLRVSIARGLAPGVVGIGDVPLLTHVVHKVGCKRNGLRRRIIVHAETNAVALGGGQRRVEADADHVDDLGLFPNRHARETDVGQEAADVDVDITFLHHLCGLLPRYRWRTFIVDNDQFDWAAIDAARIIDAVDRHLQSDNGGLAAGGAGTRQWLFGTDPVGLGGAEGGAPRLRHQHHGADRAAAPADEPPAREPAPIPELFSPLLFSPLLRHGFPSSLFRASGNPLTGFLADNLCRKQTRYCHHFQPDSVAAAASAIAKMRVTSSRRQCFFRTFR